MSEVPKIKKPPLAFQTWAQQSGWYLCFERHMQAFYLTPQGNIIKVATDGNGVIVELDKSNQERF